MSNKLSLFIVEFFFSINQLEGDEAVFSACHEDKGNKFIRKGRKC